MVDKEMLMPKVQKENEVNRGGSEKRKEKRRSKKFQRGIKYNQRLIWGN